MPDKVGHVAMDSHMLNVESKFIIELAKDFAQSVQKGDAQEIESSIKGLFAHVNLCRVWLRGIDLHQGNGSGMFLSLREREVPAEHDAHYASRGE